MGPQSSPFPCTPLLPAQMQDDTHYWVYVHSYCKRQRRCSRQPVAAALKNRNRATKIHDLNFPVSDSLPVISPYLSSPCCAFSAPSFRSPSWIFINLFIYIQHFKLPMRLSPALSYCAKYSHLGNKTYPLTPTCTGPNIQYPIGSNS